MLSAVMPTWGPEQYLRFNEERTQPCRDLVTRIPLHEARTIIDLGCGPGNSAAVLAERWPMANITGLDSSEAMLDRARERLPHYQFIRGDISEWAASTRPAYDVVLSNAALQWVTDHEAVYPQLLAAVRSGGVLAIQVPADINAPPHKAMRDLAFSPRWRDHFSPGAVREWNVHEASFYYDVLSQDAKSLELWQTEYIHVMPDAESIGEWYRGSGMRPFLDALPEDGSRERFIEDYVAAARDLYLPRPDGRILFPFRRLFLIAHR
ncbi:MAG: methyltransferase domain-containing protein [Bryobacteraceae bacterium]